MLQANRRLISSPFGWLCLTQWLGFGRLCRRTGSVLNTNQINGPSRILMGTVGECHAEFSAVEENSNAEVLELAKAFGS